jgi:hypothetical protein
MSSLSSFLEEQGQQQQETQAQRPGALSSFLEEQAQEQQETQAQRKEVLDEWKGALNSLITQFERWLREADRKNALTIDRIPITIRERRLGTYDVEGLRVRLGVREVRVEPVVRYSVGSIVGDEMGTAIRDGKVIMSSGDKGYVLFRHKREDGDEWVIADDWRYHPQPLNQATFEAAVLDLLK